MADSLAAVNQDKAIFFGYVDTSMGTPPPFYTDESIQRLNRYYSLGMNKCLVNGLAKMNMTALTQGKIDSAYAPSSLFALSITTEQTDSGAVGASVSVSCTPTGAVSGPVKLRVMVVEKDVNIASYIGSLNPSGLVSLGVIHRKSLTDTSGLDLSPLINGTEKKSSFSFARDTLTQRFPANMRVVAFVQNDSTKEVLGAAITTTPLFTKGVSGIRTGMVSKKAAHPFSWSVGSGRVELSFSQVGTYDVSVSTMAGRVMYSGKVAAGQSQRSVAIPLTKMTNGCAILRIHHEGTLWVARVNMVR